MNLKADLQQTKDIMPNLDKTRKIIIDGEVIELPSLVVRQAA